MKQFLEQYKMTITILSPVFIGSGEALTKKEYFIAEENEKKILKVLNFGRMLQDISEEKQKKLQEEFYMQDKTQNFAQWLIKNEIAVQEEWVHYEYDITECASVFADEKFRGIDLFQKDAMGNPFIPGSSIKGAIRTALLRRNIANFHENYESNRKSLENITKNHKDKYLKKKIAKESVKIEHLAFQYETGKTPRKNEPIIKNEMQGIRISDSKPLSCDDLILCQKIDIPSKISKKENALPILRECLKPGTVAECVLTIDKWYFREDIAAIEEAIDISNSKIEEWLKKNFDYELEEKDKMLYLGGGAGYLTKTVVYDLLEEEKAIEVAKDVLPDKQKRLHAKIVPNVRKTTRYDGKEYEMGLCKIEFERIN